VLGDDSETIHKLQRARLGDPGAFGDLLERHHERLRRMLAMRLDPRLRGRIDAEDVIQEAFLEATQRLPEYLAEPKMPFFLWLRFLAGQRLLLLHRHHLGVQGRDAQREVALPRASRPDASSISVAHSLIEHRTSPTQAAAREELRARVEEALAGMELIDREVLVLRQFEQLSNEEVALELGIDASAASKRFLRALRRLRTALQASPGAEELLG
jgi:RNA polymerase sigma-70 factor (ECF subfamily)